MTSNGLRLAFVAFVAFSTAAACGGIATSPPETTTTITTGTGNGTGSGSGTGTGIGNGTGTSNGTGTASSSGTSVAALTIPLGTYSSCAESLYTSDGAHFFSGGGFQASGQLVLTQNGESGANGTSVTATYTDQNGATTALGFLQGENATAILSSGAQLASPVAAECVQGPGDTELSAASFDATAGALVYEAGTLFVSLEGALSADTGPCGEQSGQGDLWITCATGNVSPAAPVPASAVLSTFAGTYACTSQIDVFDAVSGMSDYSVGGGNGTLVVTQVGTNVTAAYGGDTFLTGTMSLTLTASGIATAVADQRLSALCLAPISTTPGGGPPQTLQPLPLNAGALTAIGDGTMLLSFAGTPGTGSACPGAQTAGTLICVLSEDAGAP
jgi:hypothetical protein